MSKPGGQNGGSDQPKDQNGEQGEFIEWLKENRFEDCVGPFTPKYADAKISEVDGTDIDTVLSDKPIVAKRLKGALSRWKAAQDKEEPEAPEIPEFPDGAEFDLSQSKIEIEGKEFEIPTALRVRPSKDLKVTSPLELKKNDWIFIAKNSNMLRGFDMDHVEPTRRAQKPVLYWRVPKSAIFMTPRHLEATTSSTLVYSENAQKYVRHGFDTETASAGYAFAAASFERSHEERNAGASVTRTLYMSGLYIVPRAEVHLRECSTVSPEFKTSIEHALDSADPPTELGKVFKEYGHAVAMEVLLGGQLYFEQTEQSSASISETQQKTTYKAAAGVAAKEKGAKIELGAAVGTAQANQTTVQAVAKNAIFMSFGGKATLNTTVDVWSETVNDPKNWDVIGKSEVIPTYELLDGELKEKVLKVWSKVRPLLGWSLDLGWKDQENKGDSQRTDTSGFLIAMCRADTAGFRGSVFVASGPGVDPKEGASETAAGAAYADREDDHDLWYPYASVCIPVLQSKANDPSDYHAYRYSFQASAGKPSGGFVFISSKLSFGKWTSPPPSLSVVTAKVASGVSSRTDCFTAESDGFLFVSIDTEGRDGVGEFYAIVDGRMMAGCSAYHNSSYNINQRIDRASFCLPILAASTVNLEQLKLMGGNPIFKSYWLPMVGENAKMLPAETRSLNTQFQASTDGILYGYIGSKDPRRRPTRASLQLLSYGYKDHPGSTAFACASIRYVLGGDTPKFIRTGSAMLPVRQGTWYQARYQYEQDRHSLPETGLFWTPIVPA